MRLETARPVAPNVIQRRPRRTAQQRTDGLTEDTADANDENYTAHVLCSVRGRGRGRDHVNRAETVFALERDLDSGTSAQSRAL